jgi:SAM-dependent methyltransferase
LGTTAELCCGRGEALRLLQSRIPVGVGIDVSTAMLQAARRDIATEGVFFAQGDATMLPLADSAFDSVVMLGGIHHVPARQQLFSEISRVLKPGGRFYWREPVSDLFLWRWLRAVIYRISPALDHDTERPLQWKETVPLLRSAGLELVTWKTYGFLGFCIFMNSDVLVFNRLFRYLPGIRWLVRWSTKLDDWTVRLPFLRKGGLQVIGIAEKPLEHAG